MLAETFLEVYRPMVAAGHKAETIAKALGDNWTGKTVFEFAANVRTQYRNEAGLYVTAKNRVKQLTDAQVEEIYNRAVFYVPLCVSDEVDAEKRDFAETIKIFQEMAGAID